MEAIGVIKVCIYLLCLSGNIDVIFIHLPGRPFQMGRYRCSTQVHKTKAMRRLRVDCKINSKDALIISYTETTGNSIHPRAFEIDELRAGVQTDVAGIEGMRQPDPGLVVAAMTRDDGDIQQEAAHGSAHEQSELPAATPSSLDHNPISAVVSIATRGGLRAHAPTPMKASTSQSLSHMLNPSPSSAARPLTSGHEHPYTLAQENIRRSMAHLLNPRHSPISNLLTASAPQSSLLNPDNRHVDEHQRISTPINDGVPPSLRHLLNPSPAVSSALSSPPSSHPAHPDIVAPGTPKHDDAAGGDIVAHKTRVQQRNPRKKS
jgi:hypothetical protein